MALMRLNRPTQKNRLSWVFLCTTLWLAGCGGYETEPLVVRLSPAQAAIPAHSSAEFYAEGNFGKYSSVDWRVVEAANLGVNCTLGVMYGQTAPQPPAGCTAGWLEVEVFLGLTGYPTKEATYHAPTSPGTYHVAAIVTLGESSSVANATVTVLP
jgi:hypothetical protein